MNQSVIQSLFLSDSKLLITTWFYYSLLTYFAHTALKTLLTDFAEYDTITPEYTAGLFHFTTETINTM